MRALTPEVELREEHIIPASFGGHRTLPEGCCRDCEANQSAYIGHCCDKMFAALRFHHGLPVSRKKKLADRTVRVFTDEDTLTPVPQGKAPGVVSMPVLDLPRLLSGGPPSEDEFRMVGFYLLDTTGDGAQRQQALIEEGYKTALAHSEIHVTPFIQMLARIGHGYYMSCRHWGRDASLLLPVAQGDTRYSSQVIGGWKIDHEFFPRPKTGAGPHQIIPFNARAGNVDYLAANIRLFTHLRPLPPIYTVVLGRREIPQGEHYLLFTSEQSSHGMNVDVTVAVA